MSDIFISYARTDIERAKIIATAFEKHGLSVWWDPNIPPGEPFDEVIADALKSAKCMIVLWTESSITSGWVREEAMVGAQRGTLFPVLLDDVEIPVGFKRFHTVRIMDLVGLPAKEEFKQLLSAISATLGRSISPAEESKQRLQPAPKKYSLRRLAKHDLSFSEVASLVKQYDFYCAFECLGLPSANVPHYMKQYCNETGRGIINVFELMEFDLVVFDHATGLHWQREASGEEMVPEKTGLYLEEINSQKYGGFSNWRLPTVEEAMSLVKPFKKGGYHQDPVFSHTRCIWTADEHKEPNGSWLVHFSDGNCRLNLAYGAKVTCSVRAVRSERIDDLIMTPIRNIRA